MRAKQSRKTVMAVLVLAAILVAAGTVPATAQVTETGPFIGTLTESWESFPNWFVSGGALADPTDIMNGGASISNPHLLIYEASTDPACPAPCFNLQGNGFAQVADGIRGVGADEVDSNGVQLATTQTVAVIFKQLATAVGGYWGAATFAGAAAVTVRFFDEGGLQIGEDITFTYSSPGLDGQLVWHGWTSTTPIKRMTYTGMAVALDGLQANETSSTPPSPDVLTVDLDIRPGSCQNVLNVRSRGSLPVVVRGATDLDVAQIDRTSLKLAGVAPFRTAIEDRWAVVDDSDDDGPCGCVVTPRDGVPDLVMKFRTQALVGALEKSLGRHLRRDETLPLDLEGSLLDGTPIAGRDVVRIVVSWPWR